MKTKILMAFLAVFFLATGSAMAIPVDLSYVADGDNLVFTITNNADSGFRVSAIGLEQDLGDMLDIPFGLNYAGFGSMNGYVGGYERFTITTPALAAGDTLNFTISANGIIPNEINFIVYEAAAADLTYNGGDHRDTWYNKDQTVVFYSFFGTAKQVSVPEPATLLLLGLGLVGIGLKRKFQK